MQDFSRMDSVGGQYYFWFLSNITGLRPSAKRLAMTVYAEELKDKPMCVPGTSKSAPSFPVRQ